MSRSLRFLTPLLCTLAAAPLAAQMASGTLLGSVKDEKGRPMAGVKIVVTSPSLFNERVIKTDAKGEWRVPLLPVGQFRIVATQNGYISSSAEKIHLGLSASFRQDFSLKPIAVAEQVVEVVASAAGDVPRTETKTAKNFDAQTLQTLPTTDQGYMGAMRLTPGVVSDTASYQPTVRGGTGLGTAYRVNGADIRQESKGYNDRGQRWFVEDNVEDVQVLLSPLHARYGRILGGAVNVTTRTGTDEFHGTLRTNGSRLAWSDSNTRPHDRYTSDQLDRFRPRWEMTLNGPIIPGRLRFALATISVPKSTDPGYIGPAGAANAYQTVRAAGPNAKLINAANATDLVTGLPTATSLVPAGYKWTRFNANTENFPRQVESSYYEGKLTAAITADHTVEFSYLKADETKGPTDYYDDLWNTSSIAALGNRVKAQRNTGLVYRGIVADTWFVEGKFSRAKTEMQYPQGDAAHGGNQQKTLVYGATQAGARTSLGFPFGYIAPVSDFDENTSTSLNLNHLFSLGSVDHELDFGTEFFRSRRASPGQWGSNHRLYRAPGAYINDQGSILIPSLAYQNGAARNWDQYGQNAAGLGGPIASVQEFLGKGGVFDNDHLAFYVNDQMTLGKHWIVMGGLRWEQAKPKDSAGNTVFTSGDFSPRVQVRYDLKGDGSQLITATGARFTGYVPHAFSQYLVGDEGQVTVSRIFTGIAGQPAPGSTTDNGYYGQRFLTLDQFYNTSNYNYVLSFDDTSKSVKVDGKLGVPYMDEFTLGYTHNFRNGSSFRVTFVNRSWRNDWAFATDYAKDQMALVTDPTHSGLPSQYAAVTRVFNTDELKRDYKGLEVDWTVKRDGWQFGGNWTFSRLTGNNNGSDVPGQQIADYTVSGYFAQRRWQLANGRADEFAPYGLLSNDQTHRLNLWVSSTHQAGHGKVTQAWFLTYTSGAHYGATGIVNFNPAFQGLGADAAGVAYPDTPKEYTKYFGGRNNYAQNDRWNLNFQLSYEVPVWRKASLFAELKVTNVLNHFMSDYDTSFFRPDNSNSNFLYVDTTRFGTNRSNDPNSQDNYWNEGRRATLSVGLRF